MSTQKPAPPPDQLRRAAEAALAGAPSGQPGGQTDAGLLYELQVHQIELEMQNESLRQAQLTLEESRDRYVDLYEFAPVGYLTLSRHGQIDAINLTGAALLGDERKKLLQRRFARFVVAADQALWQKHFLQAFEQGGPQVCELRLQRSDGTTFAASLNSRVSASAAATPTLRVAITDVSERRQALADLRAANESLESFAIEQAAHLYRLASELTQAEQHERDRLYELLHDEIQPLLVAARLSLSSVSPRTAPDDSTRIAAEACAHITHTLKIARTLSLQLSPPLIRERGLIAALEVLCQWVHDNHRLTVDMVAAADAEPANMAKRLHCFNAVRELLMNVVKHARTEHVALTLQLDPADCLRIEVADHGCGFDPRAGVSGTGLANIERRLRMFGGELQIEAHPGQGTIAALTMPLRTASRGSSPRSARQREKNAQDTDRR
jgi:PAS domain S-box-containing protein